MSRAFFPGLALLALLALVPLTGCGGSVELAPATTEDTASLAEETSMPSSDGEAAESSSPTNDTSSTDVPSSADSSSSETSSAVDSGAVTDASSLDAAIGSKHSVEVSGTSFKPASLEIKKGDIVEWVWKGGVHNVISGADCSNDGTFASGPPKSTGTYSYRFNVAGTFPYHCIPHCGAGMKGKIVVAP